MEISVPVKREDIDAVSSIFDGIGTGGVVIEDPALIYDVISKGNRETVVMDARGIDPGGPAVLKGYLPLDGNLEERLADFSQSLERIDGLYPGLVKLKEIEEKSWMDSWKEFYHTFRVGRNFLVKPTWESAGVAEGLLVIEMDPGMAFGCGTHSTTSMCMSLLEDVIRGGETVLDVGTGSGILSIAAARLGAGEVLAVDYDAVAVRTAGENIRQNRLESVISARQGDLLKGIDLRPDVIVANIVADVILKLLPGASALLKEGGVFIASGIISGRADELARAITDSGLAIVKKAEEGEWAAFVAQKQ